MRDRYFERTEGAKLHKRFDMYYTQNMSQNSEQQYVKYPSKVNSIETRMGYFNYYPTDSIVERRMDSVWWEY